MSTTGDRLAQIEARLDRIEAMLEPRPATRVERPAAPAPAPTRTRPTPAPRPEPRRELDLEELLGGRVLALVGGVTVIVGLVFLIALAVQRGWLGEEARTALAFLGSATLLGLGAWLYETRGRTQAALAACGTGLAGLFLSLTAATVLYDLLPVGAALAGAFVFGAVGAGLAVRWNSRTIGVLGILGALAAPLLVGATDNAESLLFLAIAEAAAIAVLVWRRWSWLRVAAVAIVLAQLAGWVFSADPSWTRGFVVLALFGVLNLLAVTVYELRTKTDNGMASAVLITANGVVVGLLGAWVAGEGWDGGHTTAVGWWIAGVALAHVLAGLVLLRFQRESRAIAIWLFGAGLVAANIAFVVLVSGSAIPIGWAAAAAALALPARSVSRSPRLVYAVVGAQLLLAVGHVLAYDAPLDDVVHHGTTAVWPILAIAVSAFVIARLTPAAEIEARAAADATALAAVAYGTAVLLEGTTLAVAWAAEAALLAELGHRLRHRVAAAGVFGFLLLAALHALVFAAPPAALVDGADSFRNAVAELGAVAVVAWFAARRTVGLFPHDRAVLEAASGTAVVYLASVGIISAYQPGASDLQSGTLGVRQQGQAILSAFWSLLGLGLLWVGLKRNARAAARRLRAAGGRGREGLPLRHRQARPGLPRALVRRARAAAARRRLRVPAHAPRLEVDGLHPVAA